VRRPTLATLLIAIAVTTGWAIERWGPGLIPAHWSLGGGGRHCALRQVLDGDSLQLSCDGEPVEVRLHCIDAPEKGQSPWSDRSRAHLRRIATGPLELHPVEKDRYGRVVAEVFTMGAERRSLNLEQVRQGHAAVYDRYCEDPRFFRAERQARSASLGIWSTPGDHQTPWAFRQRR
jgi:endonuclease YncB( thermonuclease family)